MEYMPNGNLKELLRDDDVKLGAFLRLRICAEISKGLACIHHLLKEKRLVHGDLKAENILLSDDLHCKIGDFGSSVLSNYTENTTLGKSKQSSNEFTAIYAAPELLRNHSIKLKPSIDTYSFGMIVYMVLKRELPVTNNAVLTSYLDKIQNGQRPEIDFQELTSEFKTCEKSIDAINQLARIMKYCWKQAASERPDMKDVKDILCDLLIPIPSSEIHLQVADATSEMTVLKFMQKQYKCVSIDKLPLKSNAGW